MSEHHQGAALFAQLNTAFLWPAGGRGPESAGSRIVLGKQRKTGGDDAEPHKADYNPTQAP
jgi:hypothetical protein